MSKKDPDHLILAPGETGWEIWSGTAAAGYTLHSASEVHEASELENFPPGDITHLFPVKALTAIPMRVSSDDEALFPDLAALHAERQGLRPDPMAGQLTDLFVIASEPETTALVYLVLRAPGEGDLPLRGPKEFDASARAFVPPGEALAVWKEFGRWVFSFHHEGKLVYCQATASASREPDEAVLRDIRLAMIQLSMQGIELEPRVIHLWTSDPTVAAGALAGAFPSTVQVAPRPAPVLPEPRSKLLPDDVRSARRAAAKRARIRLAAAAAAVLYLGWIGWSVFGIWQDKSTATALLKEAEAFAPDRAAYELHMARWDEAAVILERGNWPVDILRRIANSIAPNSGLRLRTAEITATSITLVGEAPQAAVANQFNLALTRSNDLQDFVWNNQSPTQTQRGWGFTFNATAREAAAPAN